MRGKIDAAMQWGRNQVGVEGGVGNGCIVLCQRSGLVV